MKKSLNYILSTSGKYHYFEVAKILYKRNQLKKIFCGYPWVKLKNENIPKRLVDSKSFYNILRYLIRNNSKLEKISEYLNILHKKKIDQITCDYIDKNNDVDVLLNLAGTSLNAGIKMNNSNKIYICERSSAHILYQNNLLVEEYKDLKINKDYVTNNWFVESEIKEYENADIILVPSNFVKNTFDKSTFHKIKILNFGTNIHNFYPNDKIKKDNNYFDILFIGQKSIRKGLHYLVDAFDKFKHPNKRLHVIGSDTGDKEFFKKKLKNDNILIYGHVPQLKLNDIINTCHLFVLPSIEDGYGLVVLQAASGGCPSIVSENTGAADFVKQNNCGFVVPIRNSDAITKKMELLSDDKSLLNKISLNAINGSRNNTWSDYVDKLDLIVEEAMNLRN